MISSMERALICDISFIEVNETVYYISVEPGENIGLEYKTFICDSGVKS